jgi:chloramphenicol 3-O phosphotransferase
VGKSSIAKALQTIAAEPYLHVQMDVFFDMLPAAYQDNPEGIFFETVSENGKPVAVIKPGPVGERAGRGMRHAIAAMAAQGNNLIVDEVLCNGEMPEYARLLSPFELHLVGVFAPLAVIEERERRRGDRMIGLARWQYDRVHRDIRYDLSLDTSTTSALDCAKLIKEKFRL